MLPKNLENSVLKLLENHTGEIYTINHISSVSGGSINNALKIDCGKKNFFLKWNHAKQLPSMFEKEAKGMKLLYETGEIYVPEVIGIDENPEYGMILLEFVQQQKPGNEFWNVFGTQLGKLHKNHCGKLFGLDHDNFIGSLKQFNTFHSNWIDFFILQRLEIQLKMAINSGLLNKSDYKSFENLYRRLDDFFPVENPSLLHGDLWSGNFMVNHRGEPSIFDPAVYYGHRIIDIGMTKLFGGFSDEFYRAYNQEYPLENNWKESVEIANLYPLLVHVNLFGFGYVSSVRSVIKKF
ncbi:MAG: fructosamine kinase family protein [bacterium]